MMATKPLEFWSVDNNFGLRIFDSEIKFMLGLCQQSGLNETGGILIGKYTTAHDCAVLSEITPPPSDSESGRTWFKRGTSGLKKKLDSIWNTKSEYYLGEWHFHPGATPFPSGKDQKGMIGIAKSPKYSCPEPILIIVGGSFPSNWQIRAFVFRQNQIFLELENINQ